MLTTSGFQIAKLNDEQRLVFGFANVSISKATSAGKGGDEFYDLQRDSVPPDELEKAAYEFVLNFREADEMHEGDAVGHLVESMVFTPDKLSKLASDPVTGQVDKVVLAALEKALPCRWWVGFRLNDSSYKLVKSGKYKMFSIAGEAEREVA